MEAPNDLKCDEVAEATPYLKFIVQVLGGDKRAILKEALQLVASNVGLQRLFAEFNDLLEANRDDLMDVQAALE